MKLTFQRGSLANDLVPGQHGIGRLAKSAREGHHLGHGGQPALLLERGEAGMQAGQDVRDRVNVHTVLNAAMHELVRVDHASVLPRGALEAHDDGCGLLVRLEVRQQSPDGQVRHVRAEGVAVLVLRSSGRRDPVVEVAGAPATGEVRHHHHEEDEYDQRVDHRGHTY